MVEAVARPRSASRDATARGQASERQRRRGEMARMMKLARVTARFGSHRHHRVRISHPAREPASAEETLEVHQGVVGLAEKIGGSRWIKLPLVKARHSDGISEEGGEPCIEG